MSSDSSSAVRRTAVVTGAGTGIGSAIAATLLADGWQVALSGRRRDALDATASGNPHALVVPTDVSDPSSVATLFDHVAEAWGRLDLLVNNAGITGPGGTVDQLDVAAWREVVDVNLTGSFLCSRAAFALMRRQRPQGGRIINNGSIAAHSPRPGSAAYTATKHAITGLTKALSIDGRAFDIACGQIDIGNAATELLTGLGDTEPSFDVEHVAAAVRYMVQLPLTANVQFMTLVATKMPFLGRG